MYAGYGVVGLWSCGGGWLAARERRRPGAACPRRRGSSGACWSEALSSEGSLRDDLQRVPDRAHWFLHRHFALVIAVPPGHRAGLQRKVYRSLEFVVDFFRSTPASAMFPLFLVLFGIGEGTKIAVAAFGAALVILFNIAYGVMKARKERQLAARVMGASVCRCCGTSRLGVAAADFRRHALRRFARAGDRYRRRDVHRFHRRPRPARPEVADDLRHARMYAIDLRRRRAGLCA